MGEHFYCGFAGLRDGKNFKMDHQTIVDKYGSRMKMMGRVPEALSGAMGNQMYMATFSTKEELDEFYYDVLEQW